MSQREGSIRDGLERGALFEIVERVLDDSIRPLLAALANPVARQTFARVVLNTTTDAPSSRERRALTQLESAGLITDSHGSWVVDEERLRALLQHGARRRQKDGPERFLTTDGRIDRYPSRHEERDELLLALLPRIMSDSEVVSEAELGNRLSTLTDDTARLRRALVDHGFLDRDRAGTAYRLAARSDGPQ
ncbi:DUF2087 domain-containing protein [Microbacterium sp. YY-01]|uniref:DUF2087 domain-containing protein n=1 Tax=Microbacterium sp. YY-01 TaxID=3421634 RepID=UPI003D17A571